MPTLHRHASDILEPGLVCLEPLRVRVQIMLSSEYIERHRLVRLANSGRRLQVEAAGERNAPV